MMRRTRNFFIGLAAAYVAGAVILFFMQDVLLFHPVRLSAKDQYHFELPFEELNLPYKGKNLSIVKFKTTKQRRGIILFFHGNMANIARYASYGSILTEEGFDTWMIDYPGFGKTTGERTEQVMYDQALLMDSLAEKERSPLIIYGKSIGTGVASYLAANRPCRLLILETPYYSIDALARHYFPIYPVVPMTRYAFPIYSYLKKVRSPIIIFHGTGDEVVPYDQANKLAAENPGITLVTLPQGRHNDLAGFPLFRSRLSRALDSLQLHGDEH
jgi:pimeloyl-ACP methyl ester carboxylesterase